MQTLLVVVAVAGLALDAWTHLSLATGYDSVGTSPLRQGDLFRAEGGAAAWVGVFLLLRPSRRWTAAAAFVVAAGGLAAVLAYRYLDLGAIGPLPDMYEPVWYARKTASAWSQAAAAAAALALLLLAGCTGPSTPRGQPPRQVRATDPPLPTPSITPEKRDGSS